MKTVLKQLLGATAASALLAGPAMAGEDIKLGIMLGFTGPIEIHHAGHGAVRPRWR